MGFSQGLSFAVPIGTTIIGVLMTIVGMLYIDKLGRRKLLLIGSIGIGGFPLDYGIYFYECRSVFRNTCLITSAFMECIKLVLIFSIFSSVVHGDPHYGLF